MYVIIFAERSPTIKPFEFFSVVKQTDLTVDKKSLTVRF